MNDGDTITDDAIVSVTRSTTNDKKCTKVVSLFQLTEQTIWSTALEEFHFTSERSLLYIVT